MRQARIPGCFLLLLVCGAGRAEAQTAELAKLVAIGGAPGEQYGFEVSISGDRVLVGSPNDDGRGSVYYYEALPGGGWFPWPKLQASDTAAGDSFGSAVSIAGDRILIASPGDDDLGSQSGSAYVFERVPGGPWVQAAKLLGSEVGSADFFGKSVAIDGDVALVGCPYDGIGTLGSAYVFERQGNGAWIEVVRLTPSSDNDLFGLSVAVHGERALVGNPHTSASGPGSASVFERGPGGGWTEVAVLQASDGSTSNQFGRSVTLHGDRALVGSSAGAAYLFELDGGGAWVEVAKLVPSDLANQLYFGVSVSLSGDRALIGDHINNGGSSSGSAYVFERQADGSWVELAKLLPSDGTANDWFGWVVSLSGDRALVGTQKSVGAAYLFDVEPLSGSVEEVSLSAREVQVLELDAGHLHAEEAYLLLGSLAGTSPGIPLPGGLVLPLHPDDYFARTLLSPGPMPLSGSSGTLNYFGHAAAAFTGAPNHIALAGSTVQHAFLGFRRPALATGPLAGKLPYSTTVTFVSNALPLVLGP